MCGIVGILGQYSSEFKSDICNMTDSLISRGPDARGFWIHRDAGIALGHRRLSIVDLSDAGSQPISSKCGRFILVFNGEIYNHHQLRMQLNKEIFGLSWNGSSDSETLLVGLIHWGLENCLEKLTGMFAFGLWDTATRSLVLARDRMGEKPLYYGRIGDIFVFGSQLKSLKCHRLWQSQIDRDSISLFLRFGYVPSPFCIYKGIKKLPPAHYLTIKNRGESISSPIRYWDINKLANCDSFKSDMSSEVIEERLKYLLSESIINQMKADVPVGSFLSGGYDSTLVTALMQKNSLKPVKTFSIGFYEESFNEAIHAKNVAKHLGTEHSELYVSADNAISIIPKLAEIYDEPFSDVSQIPTILLSRIAAQHVKVVLSGDGGDELFCGYNRYLSGFNTWKKLNNLPLFTKQLLSKTFTQKTGIYFDKIQHFLPSKTQVSSLADRLPKLANVIFQNDLLSYYKSVVSHVQCPDDFVLNGLEPDTLNWSLNFPRNRKFQDQLMLLDMTTYLPDDILTKVDRASMSVGLEARVPLLDHRIVEFALKVPLSFKINGGLGKWILRQLTYRYVPKELMERPKMGFSVPIGKWLVGPLRDWVENLIDENRLQNEGFFKSNRVKNKWNEHLTGKKDNSQILWNILMFQLWLQES
jgi:asparagine synthase (glutamine-hydrolysing)